MKNCPLNKKGKEPLLHLYRARRWLLAKVQVNAKFISERHCRCTHTKACLLPSCLYLLLCTPLPLLSFESCPPRICVWTQDLQQVGGAELGTVNPAGGLVQQTSAGLILCMQNCDVGWLTLEAQVHITTCILWSQTDREQGIDTELNHLILRRTSYWQIRQLPRLKVMWEINKYILQRGKRKKKMLLLQLLSTGTISFDKTCLTREKEGVTEHLLLPGVDTVEEITLQVYQDVVTYIKKTHSITVS